MCMVEVEMNQETKLLLILSQVKGILKLVKDNKYEEYFISHLIPVQVELNRQLTNLKQSITIQK
jgi:hypothetical protein